MICNWLSFGRVFYCCCFINNLGGVPVELSCLLGQPCIDFKEKIRLYRENRVDELASGHAKFCDKLSDEKKKNLKDCISRMALGMSPPEIDTGMDRQLFDIIPHEDGQKIITALNPVARRAMLAHHGEGLLTSLSLVAEIVLSAPGSDYSNDVKGRIVEKYIITTMEINKLFSFESMKLLENGGLSEKSNRYFTSCGEFYYFAHRISYKITDIVHFSGMSTPPSDFNKDHGTLFIPSRANYPGFDLFYWDADQKRILGFQVTLMLPFTKHTKLDKDSVKENCARWNKYCGSTSEMSVYWVIPEKCVGNPKFVEDTYVVLLECLHDSFPALRNLNH